MDLLGFNEEQVDVSRLRKSDVSFYKFGSIDAKESIGEVNPPPPPVVDDLYTLSAGDKAKGLLYPSDPRTHTHINNIFPQSEPMTMKLGSLDPLILRDLYRDEATCDIDVIIVETNNNNNNNNFSNKTQNDVRQHETNETVSSSLPATVVRMPAHRCVLEAASPVLRSMILRELGALHRRASIGGDDPHEAVAALAGVRGVGQPGTGGVHIESRIASPGALLVQRQQRLRLVIETQWVEAVRVAIRFIYGIRSELTSGDGRLLTGVMTEASRLGLPTLSALCAASLVRPMSLEDYCDFLSGVAVLNDDCACEAALMLADVGMYVLKEHVFMSLSFNAIKSFIECDTLMSDEIILIHMLQLWLSQNINTVSDEQERQLYSLIRFESLSAHQLRDICQPSLHGVMLEACLNRLQTHENFTRGNYVEVGKPSRVNLWLSNEFFVVDGGGGRFFNLLRRQKNSITDTHTRRHIYTNTHTHIDSLRGSNGDRQRMFGTEGDHWAWTAGDARETSDGVWYFKLVSTLECKIRIGVVTAVSNKRVEELAFYFDFKTEV
eukprot:GHVR01184495.1.p1 GENE.GHVR01184495.1~~GHVR01184495.1.p1  ORF type:complete len:551 (+),score=185.70 GHVR01184495.1:377-2029(+)